MTLRLPLVYADRKKNVLEDLTRCRSHSGVVVEYIWYPGDCYRDQYQRRASDDLGQLTYRC
jgi:hypothetical protein